MWNEYTGYVMTTTLVSVMSLILSSNKAHREESTHWARKNARVAATTAARQREKEREMLIYSK